MAFQNSTGSYAVWSLQRFTGRQPPRATGVFPLGRQAWFQRNQRGGGNPGSLESQRVCSSSRPYLQLEGKFMLESPEVIQLLPQRHQGVLLLADILLQHLHSQLHLLPHADLHLQFFLHILPPNVNKLLIFSFLNEAPTMKFHRKRCKLQHSQVWIFGQNSYKLSFDAEKLTKE